MILHSHGSYDMDLTNPMSPPLGEQRDCDGQLVDLVTMLITTGLCAFSRGVRVGKKAAKAI